MAQKPVSLSNNSAVMENGETSELLAFTLLLTDSSACIFKLAMINFTVLQFT